MATMSLQSYKHLTTDHQ